MITKPIIGKIKKTIPKIGVTWCEQTVTASRDNEVKKYCNFPVFNQRYISGKECIKIETAIILGNWPNICNVSINEEENTAISAV